MVQLRRLLLYEVVRHGLAADNKCRSFVTNDCVAQPNVLNTSIIEKLISSLIGFIVLQFVAATHINEFEGNNLLISSGFSEIK